MHSTQETASHGVYTAKQTPLFSQFGLINQMIASAEGHAARGIGMGMHRQGCRQGIDRSGLYLGIAVHDYDDVMAFAFHAKHAPVERTCVVWGKSWSVGDVPGGCCLIKKHKNKKI